MDCVETYRRGNGDDIFDFGVGFSTSREVWLCVAHVRSLESRRISGYSILEGGHETFGSVLGPRAPRFRVSFRRV